LVISVSISSYSQENRIGPVTDYLTPSTVSPFKAAAGVTSLDVQCWGAGGGGGGSNELLGLVSLGAAGGGGGGGAYSSATFPVTPLSTNAPFNYTVGNGGAGGSVENINGSYGGTSTFSSTSAGGGKGGNGGTLLIGAGIGGDGGIGNFNGGKGGSMYLVAIEIVVIPPSIKIGVNRSGGGGGSAGTASSGNNASGLTGGTAVTGGGAGGNGGEKQLLSALLVTPNIKGSPGSFPGGGGGGGVGNGLVNGVLDFTENNSNGGKGADGQIKVNYICPTYSITSSSTDASCAQMSTIVLTGDLPIGTYTISYKISSGSEVIVPMVVSTAGTGSITVTGIPIAGSSTVTITKIKSEECWTKVNFSIFFNRPVKPTVGTVTHPTCAEPNGTVVLSNLVIGGIIRQTGVENVSYPITENPQAITGLNSGSYNFVVSNGICSSQTVSETVSVEIADPPPTRKWKNGLWVDDKAPTIENKVIFESSYNENVDITACSCQVNSGAYVTFKTGRYLKLRNELVVDPNGSLTFENNASLVQMSDDPEIAVKNSGNITYKRNTNYVKRYDFTYWSSPVEGQTLKKLSPNTLGDKYYSYNPSSGWVIHYNGNQLMLPGEGYIIRAPQTFSITDAAIDYNPKFEGKPNNGEITKVLNGGVVYLLGNPYPSAISADAFLIENESKLEGTLYFWTHNSSPNIKVDGDATYNYTSNDYATYNRTGGVTTAIFDNELNNPDDIFNDAEPSGNISAGQGFFAPASEDGGTIVFNNEMRLLSNAVMDNSQFFKLEKTAKSTSLVEKNRLWLNLTNEEGVFKQTLIGYITDATNGYEGSFDGISYDGNQYVDFYSINKGLNLSIQGRALPFQQKDSVALGYKSIIAGEFKISIGHTDGALAAQKVFLEDKLLQVLHDLKEPYLFTTEKGVFNDRFVLRYVDKNAVEEVPEIPQELNKEVLISSKDGVITINSAVELVDKVLVCDSAGRKLFQKNKIANTIFVIPHLISSHQILVVDVLLSNGKRESRKIVY